MIQTESILKQLDSVLARYSEFLGFETEEWSRTTVNELLTRSHAAVQRLAPPGSAYLARCSEALEASGSDVYRLELLVGVIAALRSDFALGALQPIQDLIQAGVFSDFLEMAEHLLDRGYKDPAVVLAGGVLEQHLRRLCQHRSIPIDVDGKPKSADLLNSELCKAGVYDKMDQKSVTSWQELRNRAAHGDYLSYEAERVKLLILGVRDFTRRVPS